MRRLLTLLFIHYLLFISCAAAQNFPIVAYMGVPDWQTSEENFRTFSECGFTVSLYPYATLDLMVQACRLADKYGVKVIGRCPEMETQPAKTAQTLRRERGFYGYFMQDEPNVPQIREQQRLIARLRAVDSTHCFYLNLLPYYYPKQITQATKAASYQDYLKAASATACQQLSFDFYPITTDGIRTTWYHNLEMVRHESLASGKPFWGFVLSVPHAVYPQPTLGQLRLQVYSNLAYGAQAIQYFTYWNPGPNEGFDYHNAPISRDGKKTKTYPLVQQMNKELKSVARLFYGAKVTDVSHLGDIADGTKKLATVPINLTSLKIIGQLGAVVSQFEKGGHCYLAVVNKNPNGKMTVRIKAANNTPRHVTKELKEEPLGPSYKVTAGDILLLKLK